MPESLVPAAGEFVVQSPTATKSALDRLRDLGTVERVDAAEPLLVLKVAGAKRAKDAWAATAAKLGETRLLPVLYDSDGAPHYPTGEVTVRFDAAPSDAELRRFGDSHKLRLLRRNEFAPQQAVFEPAGGSGEYLPDVVSKLAGLPGIHKAWANTLSRYRRTDKAR